MGLGKSPFSHDVPHEGHGMFMGTMPAAVRTCKPLPALLVWARPNAYWHPLEVCSLCRLCTSAEGPFTCNSYTKLEWLMHSSGVQKDAGTV